MTTRIMPETHTLAPIKVWYQPLPGTTPSKWPLVEVKLSSKTTSLPQAVSALVDSGANLSILHPQVAEVLGFNQKKSDFKLAGRSVSGTYKSLLLPESLTVSIYGYNFPLKFSVVDNPDLAFACILGQDSIFRWARLDFQGFKSFFEIKFRQDLN